jgi:hypothetical protein
MLVALLIRGMDAFREFDIIFVLTGGGPGTATQTIQMLNYRVFGLGHMGLANSFGMVTLALVALMCWVLMRTILVPASSRERCRNRRSRFDGWPSPSSLDPVPDLDHDGRSKTAWTRGRRSGSPRSWNYRRGNLPFVST